MPNPLNSGLQTIKLHWTIIDDNPKSYVLSINNSIWKNDSLHSNVIDALFSNAVGWYNLSLDVIDYSNNRVHSNLYINISPAYPTITSSTITQSSTTTSSINQRNASPGFEFITIIALFSVISIYLIIKRKKYKL